MTDEDRLMLIVAYREATRQFRILCLAACAFFAIAAYVAHQLN